jgi:hypothetical protein
MSCEVVGFAGTKLTATVTAPATGTVGFRNAHTPGWFDNLTVTASSGGDANGLVAHYSFDVAGQPGKDVVGNADAETITNVTQVAGRVGSAGSFDHGYLILPDAAQLRVGTSDFTFSAFIKTTQARLEGVGLNSNWFTRSDPTEWKYGLGIGNDGTVGFGVGTGTGARSTSVVTNGSWHHIAGVRRGSQVEIWVDGVLHAAGSAGAGDDTGQIAIGRDGLCCESFLGLIDEAKIWNRALSGAEVAAEATAGEAPDVLIDEQFDGTSLPAGFSVYAGSASVQDGYLRLVNGCMRLPDSYARSSGLSIEADVWIEIGAYGDFNIWGLYDSVSDCNSGPINGYGHGIYPTGSDNVTDRVWINRSSGYSLLGESAPVVGANTWARVKVDYLPNGTINQYVNGELRVSVTNSEYSSGLLSLRGWGGVRIDNLRVSTLP